MEILEIARTIKQNELLMAQLYAECARLFPEHADEFRNLELEEIGHAHLVEEIIEDIENEPQSWVPGSMSLATIKLISKQIQENLEDIRQGKVSARYAITYALSTELSLSEKDFGNVLKNIDGKFQVPMQTLACGFKGHYQRLKKLEKQLLTTGQAGFDDLNRT